MHLVMRAGALQGGLGWGGGHGAVACLPPPAAHKPPPLTTHAPPCRRLDLVGFEWQLIDTDAKWHASYHQLRRFKAVHGHTQLPPDFSSDDEYDWVIVSRWAWVCMGVGESVCVWEDGLSTGAGKAAPALRGPADPPPPPR